jgi:hypothetical protein
MSDMPENYHTMTQSERTELFARLYREGKSPTVDELTLWNREALARQRQALQQARRASPPGQHAHVGDLDRLRAVPETARAILRTFRADLTAANALRIDPRYAADYRRAEADQLVQAAQAKATAALDALASDATIARGRLDQAHQRALQELANGTSDADEMRQQAAWQRTKPILDRHNTSLAALHAAVKDVLTTATAQGDTATLRALARELPAYSALVQPPVSSVSGQRQSATAIGPAVAGLLADVRAAMTPHLSESTRAGVALGDALAPANWAVEPVIAGARSEVTGQHEVAGFPGWDKGSYLPMNEP